MKNKTLSIKSKDLNEPHNCKKLKEHNKEYQTEAIEKDRYNHWMIYKQYGTLGEGIEEILHCPFCGVKL